MSTPNMPTFLLTPVLYAVLPYVVRTVNITRLWVILVLTIRYRAVKVVLRQAGQIAERGWVDAFGNIIYVHLGCDLFRLGQTLYITHPFHRRL